MTVKDGLPLKYRPATLPQVIGQDHVVWALRQIPPHRIPHAMLFTGASGTGKTTLVRILARKIRCCADHSLGLMEIDAATCSGIDAIRWLVDHARYRAIGRKPEKATILDEVQALSQAAWQALLAPLEEPFEHAYWMLCTTDPVKVPETVRSRCRRYLLRPVATIVLVEHLAMIAECERIEVDARVLDLCAAEAHGNVRQALVNLETIAGCGRDHKAARALLHTAVASKSDRRNDHDLGRLIEAGYTRQQMQERLGVDRTTLWRMIKKANAAGLISKQDTSAKIVRSSGTISCREGRDCSTVLTVPWRLAPFVAEVGHFCGQAIVRLQICRLNCDDMS